MTGFLRNMPYRIIYSKHGEKCKRFGYEEYLTPLMELADIYRAKSARMWEERAYDLCR